ncbi:hypothetical protein, partial [Neisseria meningitidis]|uniref:hypothetical protein n=1 Tax=Neisseria meningitidis TaxID=487 RepID=UPI001E4B8F43
PAAVIPREAGIQSVRFQPFPINLPAAFGVWIPACAGMTVAGVSVFSDRFLPRLGAGFPLSRE